MNAQDLVISDTILAVCDYCNLSQDCIPDILEPVIRKKVKGIHDYEAVNGTGYIRRWPVSKRATEAYLGPDRRKYKNDASMDCPQAIKRTCGDTGG